MAPKIFTLDVCITFSEQLEARDQVAWDMQADQSNKLN
ncbi:hypothetical protein J568_3939, partial [Acinetobacter baumannii 6112]